MPRYKPAILSGYFVFRTILLLGIALAGVPPVLQASDLLSNVTPTMESPDFWIKKIQSPGRLLLTPIEIRRMNEENLKRPDLFLCRVKDLKEEVSGEEIFSLLKNDWEEFGKSGEVRYGRQGMPLGNPFWSDVIGNLNQEALGERNRLRFGLIVKRTDIRVFPTDEVSLVSPANYEFDLFQHSSISPGSPVGIYLISKDRTWAYVQAPFIRGWVRISDLAIAKEKKEMIQYEESEDRLIITGSFIHVFSDPFLQQTVFLAQMGSSFPILTLPCNSETIRPCYIIKVPYREIDGQLAFRRGYIPANEDVHHGFLPYSQENLARQAFKMLHEPYGWGEIFSGRDCSRFIMDIFATFGILMPRNSKIQARVGIALGQVEGITLREKKKILDRALPLATLLRFPGHIMLYLGRHHKNHYAIHSIWGIQKSGRAGLPPERIEGVVVSDLSLGRSGPSGSLLQRLTDIRFIGPVSEIKNESLKEPIH